MKNSTLVFWFRRKRLKPRPRRFLEERLKKLLWRKPTLLHLSIFSPNNASCFCIEYRLWLFPFASSFVYGKKKMIDLRRNFGIKENLICLPPDGVEGIRNYAGYRGDWLSDEPRNNDGGIFGIRKHVSGGIVKSEIRGSVNNYTLDGNGKTSIKPADPVGFESFCNAIS